MDATSPTAFSSAFSWMKMFDFQLKFHWSLFLIRNVSALVQVMAWCHQGDKPLSEPMMVRLPTHICVARLQWVKTLVEFECYWTILNTNVMALRLSEIRCFMQYWNGTLMPEAKHLGVLTHIDWHCQARLISDPRNVQLWKITTQSTSLQQHKMTIQL